MDKNEVVLRISQARNKAGLSARELSQRIGKNDAYISRLESKNDSFEPSVSALLDIIKECRITESEFFYYDMSQFEHDKRILDILRKMRPEVKNLLLQLLEIA